MPTRKQRRRREKSLRHEYETVLLDEDGNEVPLDPEELRAERESLHRERAGAKASRSSSKPRRDSQGRTRATREVQPPSWQRAFRRGGMMGGLMLVVSVFLLHSPAIGLVYAVMFVPLTYWIDRIAYRAYLRRTGGTAPKSGGAKT
jgi:hypothetical protein